MRPHSLDLRQRIVDAYQGGEGSIRELAERFAVHPATVQRYLNRREEAGSYAPRPPGGGRPRSLDARAERLLWALLREKNDLPDREYDRAATLPYDAEQRDRIADRLYRKVVTPNAVGDLKVEGASAGELVVDGRPAGPYVSGVELTLAT